MLCCDWVIERKQDVIVCWRPSSQSRLRPYHCNIIRRLHGCSCRIFPSLRGRSGVSDYYASESFYDPKVPLQCQAIRAGSVVVESGNDRQTRVNLCGNQPLKCPVSLKTQTTRWYRAAVVVAGSRRSRERAITIMMTTWIFTILQQWWPFVVLFSEGSGDYSPRDAAAAE
jgi:hypothetical protein